MNRETRILSHELDKDRDQRLTTQQSENGDGPRLVACILLLSEHAEVLSGLLRNLTTNSNVPEDLEALKQPKGFPRPEPADPWLPHVEAAKYLGISKSTLYRYAHQERIECRKIANTDSPNLKILNRNRYVPLEFAFILAV